MENPANGLPDEIALSLNARASKILAGATSSGVISIPEIARMFPQSIAKDTDKLQQNIAWLIEFFQTTGVLLVDEEMRLKVQAILMAEDHRKALRERSPDINGPYFLYNLYKHEIGKYGLLEDDEVRVLSKRVRKRKDISARNKLVLHNLRLAMRMATEYRDTGVLASLDLIQEGNGGLIKASERYDYARPTRFSTYATHWIHQSITRAIQDYCQTVRFPVHVRDWLRKVSKAETQLTSKLGREPSVHEIADFMKVSAIKIDVALQQIRTKTYSLDAPLNQDDGDDGSTLNDVIPSSAAFGGQVETPESFLEKEEALREAAYQFRKILRKLDEIQLTSERTRAIFLMRYGLDGSYESKTLEEVGEKFNLTRERIRQIVEGVWVRLERQGLKKDQGEVILSEDGLECLLRFKELTGEEIDI